MNQTFDVAKERTGLAQSVLRMRAEAQRWLAEAEAKGDRKKARSWQAELRKIEKMIGQYGLERNA